MGFLKRIKKIHSKVVHAVAHQARKDIKRTVRIANKTSPYVTGVLAGAASYFGGPVAGAAVGAIGAQTSFMLRKEYGREKGESNKDRTKRARSVRRRAAIAAGVGLGAGAVASGITTAALGGTFTQSVGAGALGQGGSQALGLGAPGIFAPTTTGGLNIVTAGTLAGQAYTPVSGIVTTLPSAAPAVAGGAVAGGASGSGAGILGGIASIGAGAAAKFAAQSGQVAGGTSSQGGLFDSFARGAEAALGMSGLGGGGGNGSIGGGQGDPNVQGTDTGGTVKLLMIAAAVYIGAKLLKVA
jgi:hypothetical protein